LDFDVMNGGGNRALGMAVFMEGEEIRLAWRLAMERKAFDASDGGNHGC
jgi:hypothetical protein